MKTREHGEGETDPSAPPLVTPVTSTSGGAALTEGAQPARAALPPLQPEERAADLAEACVRFVEKALGVRLDYQAETLPVLDHYLEEGRKTAQDRPEARVVIAQTAGAYFGEVVRKRYASWWRFDGDDPAGWRIELEPVYLSFCPVQLIGDALFRGEAGVEERFELEEADREAVGARLADLPAVSEQEFYAPSMRLEVIDIAVEAIRARRLAEGDEADAALRPEDYDA